MRPRSVAVTVTPYCWDDAADFDQIGAFAFVTHVECNPSRKMSFSAADVVVPDCGDDSLSSELNLGWSGKSTHAHLPMFIAHMRSALASHPGAEDVRIQ